MSLNTILATTPLTSTNYVLKATGTSIGNSLIWDNGTNVGIGNTNTSYTLDVSGTGRFTGALTGTSATFTSTITSNNAIGVEKNGSGTFGGGGRFYLYNAATTDGFLMQLNASNNIDYWSVTSNTASASPVITLTRAGAATFSSSVSALSLDVISASGVGSSGASGLARFITAGTSTAISVGQSNSARRLDVRSYQIITTGDQFNISTSDANDIAFDTNNTERMRIKSGGNIELKIPSSTNQGILYKDSTGVSRAKAYYDDISGEMTIGTMTGYSTVFVTNNAEKMRITSGGAVLINETSDTFGCRLQTTGSLDLYNLVVFKNTGGIGTNNRYIIFENSSNALAGSITHTGSTSITYNNTSDKRLKEDLGIITETDIIDKLKVHDFKWIKDGNTDRGLFAQEVYDVKPNAVSVGEDTLTEDGSIKYPWQLSYMSLIPDLIVKCQQLTKYMQQQNQAIQEMNTKIIQLEKIVATK